MEINSTVLDLEPYERHLKSRVEFYTPPLFNVTGSMFMLQSDTSKKLRAGNPPGKKVDNKHSVRYKIRTLDKVVISQNELLLPTFT